LPKPPWRAQRRLLPLRCALPRPQRPRSSRKTTR
jgi:hypothetical protein